MQKSITENDLRQRLLEHYKLFREDNLWLDAYGEGSGTCVITCHTYFNITFEKCRQIAKYVKRQIPSDMFTFIYVGPFHFKSNEL